MTHLKLSLDSYVKGKPVYLETTFREVGFVDDVILIQRSALSP